MNRNGAGLLGVIVGAAIVAIMGYVFIYGPMAAPKEKKLVDIEIKAPSATR